MPPTTRPNGRAHTVKAPSGFDLVFAVVFLGIAVVLPLTRGASVATVGVTTVIGVAVGAAAAQLTEWRRFAGFFGVLFAGAVVGALLGVDEDWYVAWLASVFLGGLVGVNLAWLRARAR